MTDIDDARIARRQRFSWVWLPGWLVDPGGKCSHTKRRNIYGEEMILAGYKRSRCLICGRLLPDLFKDAS